MELDRISKVNFTAADLLERIDIRRARLPSNRPSFDYDPLQNREPANPIEPWMAYLNIIRTMLGPGMLFMPLAICQGGIIMGPVVLVMVGGLLIHTHLLLLQNLTEISRQLRIPYVSYRYGFRLAVLRGPPLFHCLGDSGPQIIATFMFLSQLGICIVFVLLTSANLRDIFDWQSIYPAILACLGPFLLLIFFMKNLKVVAYVSIAGNFLNIIGFIMLFSVSFFDITGKVKAVAKDFRNFFWFIGAVLFNLSAVAVILSIDKALKKASIMKGKTGVVAVGITIPTIFSGLFGCLGYWSFGVMDENILQSLPLDDLISSFILGIYMISVAFAYPIQCYPAISVIMEVIKYHDPYAMPGERTLRMVKSVGRPLFVILTFAIAYLVPYTGAFVAFVGNLCTSILAVVFPALMDICLRYPDNYGPYAFYLVKNLILMTLGMLDWIFGIYYCGYILYIRIMTFYSPDHNQFY